ncbi:hypothetical protein [Alicyclobacillus sp. SO9]|uniref:hypothetical protein n=1 Tax=Alicyclobacillus sp. SO9 TaxID=2665646 RepID=UPI0018E85273|nr:hypothetical protein [Alicyclobacillus sp. SO9]QQE81009.1 hypothetical protein GI364_11885 [Alicyclobacillus sp. SO9]
MRVREHFLLGTEKATISVTARDSSTRRDLFQSALDAILTRYEEEFGRDESQTLLESLANRQVKQTHWRLRPEDSCWNQS